MASINQLVLGIPGGASSGDTLAIVVFSDQAITTPSGWTNIQSGVAGNVFYSAANRTLTATDISTNATWTWNLAALTSNVGYDAFVFANVTGLDTTTINTYTTPVTTMAAPSLTVTRNEMIFAFWVAFNPTEIDGPNPANSLGGTYARGNISHTSLVYTLGSNGATGDQSATLIVPSTGVAIHASLLGSGTHIVSSSAGSLG